MLSERMQKTYETKGGDISDNDFFAWKQEVAALEARNAELRSAEYLRPLMESAASTERCSGYGLDVSDFDWEYFQELLDA
jgi:hypothetical protein